MICYKDKFIGFYPFHKEKIHNTQEYVAVQLNMMLKVNNKVFRCEKCNSNMFTKHGKNLFGIHKYQCQGCNAWYEGE